MTYHFNIFRQTMVNKSLYILRQNHDPINCVFQIFKSFTRSVSIRFRSSSSVAYAEAFFNLYYIAFIFTVNMMVTVWYLKYDIDNIICCTHINTPYTYTQTHTHVYLYKILELRYTNMTQHRNKHIEKYIENT